MRCQWVRCCRKITHDNLRVRSLATTFNHTKLQKVAPRSVEMLLVAVLDRLPRSGPSETPGRISPDKNQRCLAVDRITILFLRIGYLSLPIDHSSARTVAPLI
jgi:hypothetical protein